MDDVFVDGLAVECADGTGGCFLGVGCAHELAILCDGVFPFEGHDEDGAGGHVGDELVKERLGFVYGIKGLSLLFA